MKASRLVSLLLRALLTAVFLWAAVPKIMDAGGFALAVYRYHMLPDAAVNLIAILLPWWEVAGAVAWWGPRTWRPGAAVFLFLLTAVFTIALITATARGLDISCGCFSSSAGGDRIGWLNLVRNAAMLAALAIVWRLEIRQTAEGWKGGRMEDGRMREWKGGREGGA